ncbi:MAG: ATP-binding protein [Fuerstiella sp.]
MTRLFLRFYVGVLLVLLAAWYIHGIVLQNRTAAETARVVRQAHAGGALLVADELNGAAADSREETLNSIQRRFDYPVAVLPLEELPEAVQARISRKRQVVYHRREPDPAHFVMALLANGREVVQLGPLPGYRLQEIEDSMAGWMRLAAARMNSSSSAARYTTLGQMQQQFMIDVQLAECADLPDWPRVRLQNGEDTVFYRLDDTVPARWYSAVPIGTDGISVLRFGPFPGFEQIQQKAATLTLTLVLLPAAVAIALLLRPVAQQLRRVEYAAKRIAGGDMSARVDERRVPAAKPLAAAFNEMASRTEALVRNQRELLQAVSHELRTPLARIRFAIELIETAQNDAERRQRLESLDVAADELDALVGELLSYVRMGTAGLPLRREPIVLSHALKELIPRQAALKPSIRFQINELSDTDGITVYADPRGLYRVLGNLLNNAGKFAETKVTVSAATDAGGVTIDVDDDGKGIAEADRLKVFDPFVRLDEEENRQGVGLGLALVQRIVQRHGGAVAAMDSPLGGCRIRTTWPSEPPGHLIQGLSSEPANADKC